MSVMSALFGKKILFFCPRFFGYEKEIAKELQRQGGEVTYYDERPKNGFVAKAAIRFNKRFLNESISEYYNSVIKDISAITFDYVFFVNAEAVTPEILEQLHKQQTKAVFILYMWDSFQNKKYTASILPYFDKVFSFDPGDTKADPRIRFRPLFFTDQYQSDAGRPGHFDFDLCFIGTVHSDRYKLVSIIRNLIDHTKLRGFFYLYIPSLILFAFYFLTKKNFFKSRLSEFRFVPLTPAQTADYIKRSKAILDIQHPKQSGLTMRTIEVLGADKKLITTNVHIKEYDFYHPSNIMIVDRFHPNIDEKMLLEPYYPVSSEIKSRYRLENWVKEIFYDKNV